MTTRDPPSPKRDLPQEEAIARLYRAGAREQPPAALDAIILAQARAAVETPRKQHAAMRRWAIPLSVAAVALVGVSLVMDLVRPPERELYDVATQSTEAVPPATAPAPQPPQPLLKAETRTKSNAEIAASAPQSDTLSQEGARVAAEPPAAKVAAARLAEKIDEPEARIASLSVEGATGAYHFSVSILSPDLGCQQYVDWWEVLSLDGSLIYRQTIAHSHVNEQPFTSTGGPISVAPGQAVWIRAHLNNRGYGGSALKGSVEHGFMSVTLTPGFAADVAGRAPRPDRCAF